MSRIADKLIEIEELLPYHSNEDVAKIAQVPLSWVEQERELNDASDRLEVLKKDFLGFA